MTSPVVELHALDAVRELSDDDALLVWAAQGMRRGVRAWSLRGAVVVACPDLSTRDRVAVTGAPDDAAPLLRHAIAEVGDTYRPLADASLMPALLRPCGLEHVAEFGWMDGTSVRSHQSARARWLAADRDGDVRALLEEAAPASYAWPGRTGVRRWAGVTDGGALSAVAADAWTAPGVGFLAGVAARPRARGTGAAAAACSLVLDDLLAEHGRVALMVDSDNAPAISLYERLGLRWRTVAAARVAPRLPRSAG